MMLQTDLEGQGHIKFHMVHYVDVHIKINFKPFD